jgi:hypothetical protein
MAFELPCGRPFAVYRSPALRRFSHRQFNDHAVAKEPQRGYTNSRTKSVETAVLLLRQAEMSIVINGPQEENRLAPMKGVRSAAIGGPGVSRQRRLPRSLGDG